MADFNPQVFSALQAAGGTVFPVAIPLPKGGSLALPGATIRDWFAGSYSLSADGLSVTWAERVMGSKAPDWALDDGPNCIRWWCEAEARVRYLHSDAMLKAREGQ